MPRRSAARTAGSLSLSKRQSDERRMIASVGGDGS